MLSEKVFLLNPTRPNREAFNVHSLLSGTGCSGIWSDWTDCFWTVGTALLALNLRFKSKTFLFE